MLFTWILGPVTAILLTVAPFSDAANLAIVSFTPDTGTTRDFADLNVDDRDIIGITVLGSCIYAITVKRDRLYMFKTEAPYNRTAIMQLEALRGMRPGDLVSTSGEKELLFVSDWHPKSEGGIRIWSIDPKTWDVKQIVMSTGWVGTISLTPDNRILGATLDGKLVLTSFDGRETETVDAVKNTEHAVALDESSFVVSQGWKRDHVHRVVELDSEGNVLNEFGGAEPGSDDDALHWPRYLSADCGSDVMVADYWNRRVVRLDENLKYVEDILSNQQDPQVGWPRRLFCSPTADGGFKLFVAMADHPHTRKQ